MTMKLLVGNISEETTQELLVELFSMSRNSGVSVSIPLDPKTKKHRGYAFVEIDDDDHADRAVQALNGTSMHGRALAISVVEKLQGKRKWYKLGAR